MNNSWIFGMASFVLACSTPATGGIITGNLLINPGAETGVLSPWTGSAAVAAGSVTVGAQTLGASEGSRWFNTELDVDLEPRAPGSGVNFNASDFSQIIDVRGFGEILSVTFGGDLLGLGEITSGNGAFSMGASFSLGYLDENLISLGGVSAGPNNFSIATPTVVEDFRNTRTVIPAGVAFLRLTARNTFQVLTHDGNAVEAHAFLGHDDLFLSLEHQNVVPEPSSAVFLSAGMLALVACRRRYRRGGALFDF